MTLLETMAGEACEAFTSGDCTDPVSGRTPDAPYLADRYCSPCRLRAALAEPRRGAGEWADTLRYAATALEGSADNGDRYCAAQIRAALAKKDTTVSNEDTSVTETDSELRLRVIGNLLFGEERVQAEMDRLRSVVPKRVFPASFEKDRQQALHELWVNATSVDCTMSHDSFVEAIELVESETPVVLTGSELVEAAAAAIVWDNNESDEDESGSVFVDWPADRASARVIAQAVLNVALDYTNKEN
ncbi:hypothetical protein SEA_CECE_277 [Microbacterium phage Cece]|nr:hypothetical protein SEA_CECE_277 [Microbacterium phage Cece]